MSGRNTLKNLGTVLECAENCDEGCSSTAKKKKISVAEIECSSPHNDVVISPSIGDDGSSFYQSAHSSMDDFINVAPCETSLSLSKSDASEGHYFTHTPIFGHQITSEDDLSEYVESDDENEIIKLPNVTTIASSSVRSSSHPHGLRPKNLSSVIGRPFNNSRLSLLTFLNNIATPSIRTAHSTQRINQSKSSNKSSLLSFTTAEMEGSRSADARSIRSTDALHCPEIGNARRSNLTPSPAVCTKSCEESQPTSTANATPCVEIYRSTPSTSERLSTGKISPTVKNKSRECVICCVRQPATNFVRLVNCGHRSCCRNCMLKYLNIEIMENRTALSCPQCSESMHVNDAYALLAALPRLLERYESFAFRRVLSAEPDTRWCPAPDCTYAVIASACAACPQLTCERPGCGTMFCYHCKNYWHADQTCDQARDAELAGFLAGAAAGGVGSFGKSLDEPSTSAKTSKGGQHFYDVIKSCPRCAALIVKMNDGSCNHMTCGLCGVEFCWLCMKQINELHYISPTGCTFWGKKPWTRKKKLLWQIGTLIGAPLGIALIAGLAVPGIICGVPIFVGRRTYQRFAFFSRGKRHLITAVGVTGSLLVSPVLAVMAVGVGVPIMLAYVYGVVPLSLCRNGGCGAGADAQEMPYTLATDEVENTSLLNSESQERFQLLRALCESQPSTVRLAQSSGRRLKKPSVEVTISDRSNVNSPSGTIYVSSLRKAGGRHHITGTGVKSSASCGEATKERIVAGGDASVGSLSTLPGRASGGEPSGCSVSRVVSTHSQATAYHSTHRRQHSNESGVMSFCDKLDSENASVKAIAGSQYNYDDRSVNTIWSGGVDIAPHTNATDATSGVYLCSNDENASMKACGGSVFGARSLAEIALPQLAFVSRDNDTALSPVAVISPCRKAIDPSGEKEEKDCCRWPSTVGSISPSLPPSRAKPLSTSCDKLHDFRHMTGQCSGDSKKTPHGRSKSVSGIDAVPSFKKKASIITLPSASQRSLCRGGGSSVTSVVSSNCSAVGGGVDAATLRKRQELSNRVESSRMSLRKWIRRPLDLFTGRMTSGGNTKKAGATTTTAVPAAISDVRDDPIETPKASGFLRKKRHIKIPSR